MGFGKAERIVLGVVSVALFIGLGLLILQNFQDVATGQANTSIGDLITKLTTTVTWVGVLIVVAFAAIVLGMVRGKELGG